MMRKHHSPQFKAKTVLAILSGEKELNAACTENNLNPNMVRKWKQEFLDNAHNIFDNKTQNKEYKELLKELGIRQSMDGRSLWAYNIMIERWFRSFKTEEIYSNEYSSVRELREAIARYVNDYNTQRPHEALEYCVPDDYFYVNYKYIPKKVLRQHT